MTSLAHHYWMQEGKAKGKVEGLKLTAFNMLKKNLDLNLIVEVTGLSKNDITELKSKL